MEAIVVVGHQPNMVSLGATGWSAQFYGDGIARMNYVGSSRGDWYYTMDHGPNTTSATATIPPRSLQQTQV